MGDPVSRHADITRDQDARDFSGGQAEAMFAQALAEGRFTSEDQLAAAVEVPSTGVDGAEPSGEPLPPSGGHATRPETERPGRAAVGARRDGFVRAKAPRWRRFVRRMIRKARASRRQREGDMSEYERQLLEVAKRVLSQAARGVRRLISGLRHGEDQLDPTFDLADFRDALAELGDSSTWQFFLQALGLGGSKTARMAVADLAEHVARVTKNQISEDSLQVLLLSIDTLLAEIETLDARLVSPERAEFLKATAERIGVQVTAASAAISASAGAGGGDLTSRVIIAGLAGCVASEVVAALHDWRVQANQRSSLSERALLAQAHQDLVRQLEMLAVFVSDAAHDETTPLCDDHVARRAHLQSIFLLMYSQFLLAGLMKQNIEHEYANQLRKVRTLLQDIGGLIERKKGGDAIAVESQMDKILVRLPRYRTFIESV